MTTKQRKTWSWFIIVVMACCVLGIGYRGNLQRQESDRVTDIANAQARRAELIILSAPIPLIMCDETSHITVSNPAAEQLFGYTHKEMIGMPVERLIPPDQKYDHDSVFTAAGERARARPERRYALYRNNIPTVARTKSGVDIGVSISIRVIKYGDDIEFIATIRPRNDGEIAVPEIPVKGVELPSVEARSYDKAPAMEGSEL